MWIKDDPPMTQPRRYFRPNYMEVFLLVLQHSFFSGTRLVDVRKSFGPKTAQQTDGCLAHGWQSILRQTGNSSLVFPAWQSYAAATWCLPSCCILVVHSVLLVDALTHKVQSLRESLRQRSLNRAFYLHDFQPCPRIHEQLGKTGSQTAIMTILYNNRIFWLPRMRGHKPNGRK